MGMGTEKWSILKSKSTQLANIHFGTFSIMVYRTHNRKRKAVPHLAFTCIFEIILSLIALSLTAIRS